MLSPSNKPIVLLPVDKQLAKTLGISEAEYKWFVRECYKHASISPSNENPQAILPVTLGVIFLTIGTLLQAAAMFFKPKPSAGGGGIRQNTDQGQNIVNQTEFAPKAGFDSLQNVVEIGSTIPVIYAKRETINNVTYGGVRINTNLLWSQMMSFGGNQLFRAIYMIGEATIGELDIKQFAFGENILGGYDLGTEIANANSARMTFYVSKEGGRIVNADRVAGRNADKDPGNATNDGGTDVFQLRAFNNQMTSDFCYAYKPSTQTTFGVFSFIGAGFCFRQNPALRPAVTVQTEPADKNKKIRVKCSVDGVAVTQRDKYNQRYSTYAGYTELRGGDFNPEEMQDLNVGDVITYVIQSSSDANKKFIGPNLGEKPHEETCKDIAQTVAGLQRGWDEALSVGDLYKLGTAHLVCESRSPEDEIFVSEVAQDPVGGGQTMTYTFRVVKAGRSRMDKPDNNNNQSTFCATVSGHLLKMALAAFSLPRAAQVIEIGFKSTVGIRINGLCNFRDTLSQTEIDGRACNYYKNRKYKPNQTLTLSNYSSGTFSGAETRYSFFRIGYRIAGSNDEYVYMTQNFGIRGLTQQNSFNYIRLQMPSFAVWEYKFEPITGYEVRHNLHGGDLEILDAKVNTFRSVTSNGITAYFNGLPVSRSVETFQMIATKARGLGIAESDTNDYADSWGRVAEAFPFQEIQTSASRGPEHEIAYVNIITPNATTPNYDQIGLVGVNIRSGVEFSQLKQLSVYVSQGCANGIHTFPEILSDLLKNARYGVGSIVSPDQIDDASFADTAQWTRGRNYFWDGTLDKPVNIRQWASQTASYFLLDLIIKNGKWGLQPAFYFDRPEEITGLYTLGNIIEDSFEFVTAPVQQRTPKRVSIKWRHERPNNINNATGIFPLIREVNVREATTAEDAPLESIDLSDFCTNQAHAIDVAKFICRQSRLTTNTIRFKTVPTEAGLQIGRCFKLGVETVKYLQPNNGVIDSAGNISSVTPIADGTYTVLLWDGTGSTLQEVELTVEDNIAIGYTSSIFCIKEVNLSTIAYKAKSMSFDEDGNLEVEATVFPLRSNGYALITENWDSPSAWIIEGQIGSSQNTAPPPTTPVVYGVSISGRSSLYVGETATYVASISSNTGGTFTGSWSGSGVSFGTPNALTTTVTSSTAGTKTIQFSSNGKTATKAIQVLAALPTPTLIGTPSISGLTSVSTGTPINYTVSYPSKPAAIGASAIVAGRTYQIVSLGSSDFTTIGATSNTVNTVFTATAAGTGNGTVSDINNTFLSWSIDGNDASTTETENSFAPVATVTFNSGGTYTVSVEINSTTASDSPQTATLQVTAVAPVITVLASDPDASEVPTGGTPDSALFVLTRTGITTSELTVSVTITGTATPGADFTVIPSTVTFAAGSATANVPVDVIYDTTFESAETVVLTIEPGDGYEVGTTPTATATIAENSRPVVSIFPVSAGVTGNVLSFVLTRFGSLANTSSIPWSVVGSSVNPALAIDFVGNALPSGTVSFAANEATKTLEITTNSNTTNIAFLKSFNVVLGTPVNATLSTTDYSALGLIFTESSTSSGALRNQSTATINCAANATVTGTITLPRSCVIIAITVNKACWFRLYSSVSASGADAARLRTASPGLATGVVADPVLPGAVTLNFEPAPVAMSRESPVSTSYPFRLTNDSTSGDVVVTLTYLSLQT